ncbi:MAG: serine/threonine-protein kinase [Thermoanaerobaculia bacterium]
MASCKGCGNPIPSGAKVCPVCGLEIPRAQMFSIGEIFDEKYEILSFLGAGGMGEIYKVKHIHLEDTRVIKIMRQAFAQEEQDLKRFLLEAKIATKLHHPHVAILYDFSQYKTGLFYMVWEYIPGFDLSHILKKCGKMPPGIAIYFMSQALDGLGFIHKNGIVHRDISPENLMIYRDQFGDYKLKIIDLGIAKTTGLVDQHLTQTGMFLGKLKYCSPEQVGALEEGEKIDGRTDIYSIALVLYEMISGKSAIYSTTPYGYIHKHITQIPDPLNLPELSEEENKKLNEVIFKALEKNRKNRFQTAEHFKEELLFLPIKEPEQEDLHNYLKPLFIKEEKEERPTIITPPKPPEKVEKEEKETILKTEKTLEQKETILATEKTLEEKKTILKEEKTLYTPPKPQPIPEKREVKPPVELKEAPPLKEKKKNLKPFIFGSLSIFLVLILAFLLIKVKGKEAPDLSKEKETTEETQKIPEMEKKSDVVNNLGFLKLHTLPYGKIKNLANIKGEEIVLKDKITPLFLSLPEGKYKVVLELGNTNQTMTINFEVEKGKILEIIKPAPNHIYEKVLDNLF